MAFRAGPSENGAGPAGGVTVYLGEEQGAGLRIIGVHLSGPAGPRFDWADLERRAAEEVRNAIAGGMG